ncbi:MAG: hypothetical protein PWQ88_184 [Candidatus Methanomethylophilaceae archaeon]|nr:hypothetical protein [Candidatus Methanomethylophilaceae archaeon]
MRIGIIACEIFKDEIEALVDGDDDIVHKEFLEFGLHIEPEKMRQVVVEKANAIKNKVDAVMLGYCYCQSLMGVTKDIEVPAEMIHTDDCIGVFLTPIGYAEERRRCPGTWYNSPGWTTLGIDGVIRELRLDTVKDEIDPMELLHMIFASYSRCLFIDTGAGDTESLRKRSHEFAETMDLKHEERKGSYDLLKETLKRVKTLAKECVKKESRPEAIVSSGDDDLIA